MLNFVQAFFLVVQGESSLSKTTYQEWKISFKGLDCAFFPFTVASFLHKSLLSGSFLDHGFFLSFVFCLFFFSLLDFFFLGHKKSTVRSFFSANGTRKLDNMVALDMVLPLRKGSGVFQEMESSFPAFHPNVID